MNDQLDRVLDPARGTDRDDPLDLVRLEEVTHYFRDDGTLLRVEVLPDGSKETTIERELWSDWQWIEPHERQLWLDRYAAAILHFTNDVEVIGLDGMGAADRRLG